MFKNLALAIAAFLFISCSNSEEKKESDLQENLKIGQTQASYTPQSDLEKSMERGALVYSDFCMQCHLANGKGVPGNFPPLAGSNWLAAKRTKSIYGVKFGQQGEIEVNGVTYNGVMLPMGLSEKEIADVMNYVMNSWGNTQEEMVTEQEVSTVEK